MSAALIHAELIAARKHLANADRNLRRADTMRNRSAQKGAMLRLVAANAAASRWLGGAA